VKKRLVTCLAIVALFAVAAVAGPYFWLENEGLVLAPSLVVGADAYAQIGQSDWNLGADLAYFDNDLLAIASPWQIDFDLSLDYSEALMLSPSGVVPYGVEFGVASTLIFDPANYPAYLGLDTWTTELSVSGRYGVLSLFLGAEFPYTLVNPPGPIGWIGTWGFVPTFGLGCHW